VRSGRWIVSLTGSLVLVLTGISHVFGQAPSADVSGKWVGALDIVHADGSVDPDQAFLSLTVSSGSIAGTAGNSIDHQAPIRSGTVNNNRVTFETSLGPDKTVTFVLEADGDHMHGTATGLPVEEGSRVIVDVNRGDKAWHSPTPVKHVPDRLFSTIAALDEKLFNAYNHCDLVTMGTLVTDDLEFYHDQTGLSVGKQVFLDAIRNNICGKTERQLIPGSMEVYRLDHYGAVEIGRHRFTHPGHAESDVGEAKFINIWRFKDGNWQITRAISYDHEAAKTAVPSK
jgi:ketosteroid isomerase-like protein